MWVKRTKQASESAVVLTCSCEAFDQGVGQLARSDEPHTHAV